MKLVNEPDSKLYQRTMTEVMESTRHGKLYRVASVHGQKMIVQRCRMRGTNLVAVKGERLTLERGPNFLLTPCEGDFCFVDNGPKPCWALWKVMDNPKHETSLNFVSNNETVASFSGKGSCRPFEGGK